MNERIRLLAEQAGLEMLTIPEHGWNKGLEKFAELIVKECIAVHEDDYGVDIIGDVLKKHFGVEE